MFESVDGMDEHVTSNGAGFTTAKARGMSEGGEFGYATETKTAQTDELNTAEGEESQRFVIR